MGAMTAFAATKTVTVNVNANGGKFSDNTTTYTKTVTVDSDATTINLGQVDGIPSIVSGDANKAFDFWAAASDATSENLVATIDSSTNTANFYAIWKNNMATNNRELDGNISVSGLETNDVANFYQVLVWNQDAVKTKGWVPADAYRGYSLPGETGFTPVSGGLTEAEVQRILGLDTNGNPVTVDDSNRDNYGISADLAARLAGLTASAKYANITASNGTASQSNPDAGLYMVMITPGVSGVTYNPVFVGADYNGNSTNFHTVDLEASYSPASVAKKSKVTLEKTAATTEDDFEDKQPESVAAGDEVTFTIETTIPKFANNYTNAKFFVTDTLTKGLELLEGTDNADIKVYEGWFSDETLTEANKSSKELAKTFSNSGTTETVYDITVTKGENTNTTPESFVVDFKTAYLLNGMGSVQKNITIQYKAKVTTDAPRSVNLEKNTVTVSYSNNPSDGTGNGKLKDETKHYTFDIDANILGPNGDGGAGSTPWQTTEVVKVGLDKDGNEITDTKTLHGVNEEIGWTEEQKVGALQGAEFKLYKAVKNATTGNLEFVENDANIYTNDIMKTGYKIVSDANGRLTIHNLTEGETDQWTAETTPGIRGLDIGTYYLKETQAPAGYIKQQDAVKVEIIAPKPEDNNTENDYWKLVTYNETNGTQTVTWSVWELKKYDVKINNAETASYTFTNTKEENGETTTTTGTTYSGDAGDAPTLGDHTTGAHGLINDTNNDTHKADGKITNTQGVELPSTGGIGTTIFYVVGAILVIGAGVIMITRRRMDA